MIQGISYSPICTNKLEAFIRYRTGTLAVPQRSPSLVFAPRRRLPESKAADIIHSAPGMKTRVAGNVLSDAFEDASLKDPVLSAST